MGKTPSNCGNGKGYAMGLSGMVLTPNELLKAMFSILTLDEGKREKQPNM